MKRMSECGETYGMEFCIGWKEKRSELIRTSIFHVIFDVVRSFWFSFPSYKLVCGRKLLRYIVISLSEIARARALCQFNCCELVCRLIQTTAVS